MAGYYCFGGRTNEIGLGIHSILSVLGVIVERWIQIGIRMSRESGIEMGRALSDLLQKPAMLIGAPFECAFSFMYLAIGVGMCVLYFFVDKKEDAEVLSTLRDKADLESV